MKTMAVLKEVNFKEIAKATNLPEEKVKELFNLGDYFKLLRENYKVVHKTKNSLICETWSSWEDQ